MATLKGKTVLVIRGSAGIGYGVALAALQSYADKVIIASHSRERLADAEKRLRKEIDGLFKGEVDSTVLDAKDLNSVKMAVESDGEIDHLVFSSGDELRRVDFKSAQIESTKGPSLFDYTTDTKRLIVLPRGSGYPLLGCIASCTECKY